MEIFGEEYNFMLTVGASAAIADCCPDGDLNRLSEILDGKFSQTIDFTAKLVEAMAKGYDDAQRFAGKEVTHKPLTAEMVKALPGAAFKELQSAAFASFKADSQASVEVAPPKKEENLPQK